MGRYDEVKVPPLMTRFKAFITAKTQVVRRLLKRVNRQTFANVFMVSFILFTSTGAAMYSHALGFVVAGVACGLFGFLLGLE